MAFDELYYLPDMYTLAALVCNTLEGLWSQTPRRIGEILPYFADASPRQSTADMLERFKMMAARQGKPK